jgi:hypothetical protein
MGPAGLPADAVRVLITAGQARSADRGNSMLGAGGSGPTARFTIPK